MTYYGIAELDEDGKPASYLNAVAATEFASDPTYRLTTELDHGGNPTMRRSRKSTPTFNSAAGSPHLTVIELPAEASRS